MMSLHFNHHGGWYGIIFDPDEKCIKISIGQRYLKIRRKKHESLSR